MKRNDLVAEPAGQFRDPTLVADHVGALVADWQLIADLLIADVLLWMPTGHDSEVIAVAQGRPATGMTVFHDDMVGSRQSLAQMPLVAQALREPGVHNDSTPQRLGATMARRGAASVVVEETGDVIGVLAWHTNLATGRTPSRLELTYSQCGAELVEMVTMGLFPPPPSSGPGHGAPRVGDGLLRVDPSGDVQYASPNGLAALHRLGFVGNIAGRPLAAVVAELGAVPAGASDDAALIAAGRRTGRAELRSGGAVVVVRCFAMLRSQLVLCRDVTELRRREQQLLTRDATIREIHHRVKNNLQTVAALLRLQQRRIESPEAKHALAESVRRVASIAVVHEQLSQHPDDTVDFDDLVDRTLALVPELASVDHEARIERVGSFGTVGGDQATALALVLNELIANAIEHGTDPDHRDVLLSARRDGDVLFVEVSDDGPGLPTDLPDGGARTGLGMQILQALVTGELSGEIAWRASETGGTRVVIEVQLSTVSF